MFLESPLGAAALIAGFVYLMIAVISWEVMAKDVEIDNTPFKERSEAQKGIQFLNICLNFVRLGLAIGTLILIGLTIVL